MKKSVILILVTSLVLCITVAGQEKFVSNIKIQTYEKWWGLRLAGSFAQPFSRSFSIDTSEKDNRFYTTNVMYSNKGRYIWSNEPMKVSFDGTQLSISSDKEKVEAVRGGSSLREAYLVARHKYFPRQSSNRLSSDMFSMPLYELEDKLIHSQDAVEQFVSKVIARKYPVGYIIIPNGWCSQSVDMEFSRENYPEPPLMINKLHENGFKVMLSINSYIPANGRVYVECMKSGSLIVDTEGKPIVVETDSGYYACLKMTEETVAQINLHMKSLQERYGLDGFYVDYSDAYNLYSKMPARQAEYAAMWNKACEGVENVLLTYSHATVDDDSAYAFGMSRTATWKGMTTAVSTALKGSLFGYSGFAYAPELRTGDVVTARAVQLALMMPIAVVPSAAWNLKNSNVLKAMLDWRRSIADYMQQTVNETLVTSEPVMRSMEYQFGGSTFYTCEDEFMLGSKYLVAPVLEESQFRMVRLPKGTWVAPGGEKYRGPRIVNVNVENGGYAIFELQTK